MRTFSFCFLLKVRITLHPENRTYDQAPRSRRVTLAYPRTHRGLGLGTSMATFAPSLGSSRGNLLQDCFHTNQHNWASAKGNIETFTFKFHYLEL